jgi:hypothetical protein
MDSSHDSRYVPIDPVHRQELRLVRFDPTITTGMIIQIIVFIGGMAVAYAAYREEQAMQDGRIGHLEAMAATDREAMREAMRDIKTRIDHLETNTQEIKESLAVLRAQHGQTPAEVRKR